jgi:hypothetical protein
VCACARKRQSVLAAAGAHPWRVWCGLSVTLPAGPASRSKVVSTASSSPPQRA